MRAFKTMNGACLYGFRRELFARDGGNGTAARTAIFVYRSSDFTGVRIGKAAPNSSLKHSNGNIRIINRGK